MHWKWNCGEIKASAVSVFAHPISTYNIYTIVEQQTVFLLPLPPLIINKFNS
jgi:hypothetical protein